MTVNRTYTDAFIVETLLNELLAEHDKSHEIVSSHPLRSGVINGLTFAGDSREIAHVYTDFDDGSTILVVHSAGHYWDQVPQADIDAAFRFKIGDYHGAAAKVVSILFRG